MLYQIGIAVGGMVTLVSLFLIFHQLANRMRALNGECQMNTLRCLGCMATGRCGQKSKDTKSHVKPDRPNIQSR